jgi:hypothetical protein
MSLDVILPTILDASFEENLPVLSKLMLVDFILTEDSWRLDYRPPAPRFARDSFYSSNFIKSLSSFIFLGVFDLSDPPS